MENAAIKVLLVTESSSDKELIASAFAGGKRPVVQVLCEDSLLSAEALIEKRTVDACLLDLSVTDCRGVVGIRHLCNKFPFLPVVVLTEAEDYRQALAALRDGAQDFFLKSKISPHIIRRVVLHAIERKRVDVVLNNSRRSLREAQRLEMLGRLSAKVAHDFNNILGTIIGYADLLLEDNVHCKSVSDIAEIKKASERGRALTARILAFSRREETNPSFLDANNLALGLVGMMGRLLPDKISLKTKLSPNLPLILAASCQINQILANLILNSRDAMPDGGTITISTSSYELTSENLSSHNLPRQGSYVCLSVTDNGVGMSDDTIARLFDPFFTTKPAGAGTGLGLAVVDEVMSRLGGGIGVESKLGDGATFRLFFPVFQELPQPLPTLKPANRNGAQTGTKAK